MVNRDRPYAEEAAYVASKLRGRSNILEFGSGTGRHGKILASLGFHVHGIELSQDMVEFAQCISINGNGSFDCQPGDIKIIRLDKKFDAVIALFHVMSYQISDADFTAAIESAAHHLDPGGLFIFDVWHGPAVAFHGLANSDKIVQNDNCMVTRRGFPTVGSGIATMHYEFDVVDHGEHFSFTEDHRIRYYHPQYIRDASQKHFSILSAEEMLTGGKPTVNTWSVTYVMACL